MKIQGRWTGTTQNSLFLLFVDELRWARGGAQRPVLHVNEPKKTDARSARARPKPTSSYIKGYRQLSKKETQNIIIWHCVCIILEVLM
jgi:hypothetical protein